MDTTAELEALQAQLAADEDEADQAPILGASFGLLGFSKPSTASPDKEEEETKAMPECTNHAADADVDVEIGEEDAGAAAVNGSSVSKGGGGAKPSDDAEVEAEDEVSIEEETVEVEEDEVEVEPDEEPASLATSSKPGAPKQAPLKAALAAEDDEEWIELDQAEAAAQAKQAPRAGKSGKGQGKAKSKAKGKAKAAASLGDVDSDEEDVDDDAIDDLLEKNGMAGGSKGSKGGKGGNKGTVTDTKTGYVRKYFDDKGIGWLKADDGSGDTFFHITAVVGGAEFMPIGAKAEYAIIIQDGRERAGKVNVTDWTERELPEDNKGKGKGKSGKSKLSGKSKEKEALWEEWSTKYGWEEDGEKNNNGAEPSAKRLRPSVGDPQSVEEWKEAQERLFGHMPPLPANWIRIKSQSKGTVYRYNVKTGESKDGPNDEGGGSVLPPHWQKKTSNSTGKVYYYNDRTGESTFEFPR